MSETPFDRDDEPREEELPELDFADPLKRADDDDLPGLDPVVIIPTD